MASVLPESASPAGYCPQCGYDQRGRSDGAACPECGRWFARGAVLAEVNVWTDRTLLNLWSVAVLQIVGMGCGLAGLGLYRTIEVGGVMLGITAVVYLFAGSVWYGWLAVAASWQRCGASYRNLSSKRRSSLRFWLLYDAVLVLLPIGWAAVWAG